jgi:hypothetical protein
MKTSYLDCEEALHAIRSYKASTKLQRVGGPVAGERLSLIGFCFYSTFRFFCECCKPKVIAALESFRSQPCSCGCGDSMEPTINRILAILANSEPSDDDNMYSVLGRLVLIMHHDMNLREVGQTTEESLRVFIAKGMPLIHSSQN